LKVHKHQKCWNFLANSKPHSPYSKKFRFFSFDFCQYFYFQNLVFTGPWHHKDLISATKLNKYFMLVCTFKTKISVTCRVVCKTSSSRCCCCRPSCPRPSRTTLTTSGPSMTAGRRKANLSATNCPDGPWWSLVYGVW
jgi:hypothetical protein